VLGPRQAAFAAVCLVCLRQPGLFSLLLYMANYNLLNIDRVISKVEVREGCEAGTIHRWFTGALLSG